MSIVLAPIDGSARALRAVPWAAKLAGPTGTVLLLRVIPAKPAYADSLLALAGQGEEGIQRIQAAWKAATDADFDEAAQTVPGAGAAVERVVEEGEPEEAIVATAVSRNADMIAMASHGRGAIGRAIFGSVADRVARTSPVPVLILRTPEDDAGGEPVLTRIVVPLDGSQIAERALPVASRLARQLALPVHVVRAIDPTATLPVAPGIFGAAPGVSAEITEQIWGEAEDQARETVGGAVNALKAEGIEATGATLNGSPFFAIGDATQPGDLIVLTSHGRGGVGRWLLGSVAEKLVRDGPAPVLLVPAPERMERAESA